MLPCFLIIEPHGIPPYKVELSYDGESGAGKRPLEESTDTLSVYSDLEYEFVLEYPELSTVADVSVYINDVYEPSVYGEGRISFPSADTGVRKIFIDCYGYIELGLKVRLHDGSEILYRSKYLSVLVKKGRYNEAVQAMVQYVYDHQDLMLFNGMPQPEDISGLKEGGRRTLTAKLILAEELARIYEASYGYFKANSRFRIERVAKIDYLERLQYVTSETMAYLVSHPEQLKPVTSTAGILIGDRIYQPQKVLSLQNVSSYDIYENRVIVGFLRKMIDEITLLKKQCESLLGRIPTEENYNTVYVYSTFFMFSEIRKMLENDLQRLADLQNRFARLWNMYRTALAISEEPITGRPHPTAVFLSVPQYNRIFVGIHQWYNYGTYAFEKERFLFSFIKISSLYENYLLAKLLMYLKDRGYTKKSYNRYVYPISGNAKYKNTPCANTFSFSDDETDVTLYYQPVIFTADHGCVNGIGLYRNNTLPVNIEQDDIEQGGRYYVPDYLLKFESEHGTQYVLLDAKFSELASVRKYYVKELAFKYLFSVSPVSSKEQVAGLCIIYGKCSDNEKLQSAYNKQVPGNPIRPFAEMLPMIEGIAADRHYEQLDQIFNIVAGL